MARIRFSHVSKVYLSGTEAVKNFNLEIDDGEFVVLVGSSGCGKSTILRMLAGLEDITTGELRIDGEIANEMEPKQRNIAMVFQNYALFPNLTVEGNMEFALKMQKVPKKERQERVIEMARRLGIEDLLPRKAKGLSGGQCQRIAIGRALVCRPNVFLLDEPLSNLDAVMRGELRTQIAELQRELGVTTLYVTHDQTEAMALGDRVIVMDDGMIQQVDTPQNIYLKPQNTFVARFLGGANMNLINARCIEHLSKVALQVDEGLVVLPDWKGKVLAERGFIGKEVMMGIRAEDVYPVCEGTIFPEVLMASLRAELTAIEVLGHEKKLHTKVGAKDIMAIARTSSKVSLGDVLELNLPVNQIHIFCADTQQALT